MNIQVARLFAEAAEHAGPLPPDPVSDTACQAGLRESRPWTVPAASSIGGLSPIAVSPGRRYLFGTSDRKVEMNSDSRLQTMLQTGALPQPYTKTHPFSGEYLNTSHEALGTSPLQEGGVKIIHPIRGSLRRGDAATIYELAYLSKGPTADIGSNRGLSGAIAGGALRDANSPFCVQSVDLDARMQQRATEAWRENKITNVVGYAFEAAAWLHHQATVGQKFGFIFVDHSHEYEPVVAVCKILPLVMLPGAYVAFHDFADRRNADPTASGFDVVRAAIDGLSNDFAFKVISGCIGVFEYNPEAAENGQSPRSPNRQQEKALVSSGDKD